MTVKNINDRFTAALAVILSASREPASWPANR
jgi:hypothetical protein